MVSSFLSWQIASDTLFSQSIRESSTLLGNSRDALKLDIDLRKVNGFVTNKQGSANSAFQPSVLSQANLR